METIVNRDKGRAEAEADGLRALTRRGFLRYAAAGAAVCLAPPWAFAGKRGTKPNVLLLRIDDLRPELGCYGQAHIHSPHIDRLAKEGVVFERAYVQAAACAPSRASFLTGCYPDTTGVPWFTKTVPQGNPKLVTLPRHFRAHGYDTFAIDKVFHHGLDDDPKAWTDGLWRPSVGFPHYASEQWKHMTGVRKDRGPVTEAADVPDNAYRDGMNADRAIQQLNTFRERGRPFSMAVGFIRPHLPFNCPKKYWDLYERGKLKLPKNIDLPAGAPKWAGHDSYEPRMYAGLPKNRKTRFNEAQMRRLLHGYYACVSYIDAQVGRVLKALEDQGLAENTVVVLWSDHGWHLGEHGIWGKATDYEWAMRTDLIVRAPGVAPGRTHGLTDSVDVFPSLCELCGIPAPRQLEGISFVPLLNKPGQPWAGAAFGQLNSDSHVTGYTVRTDRYRLVLWRRGRGSAARRGKILATQLFDHQTDPGENTNVAKRPEYAPVVRELSALLARDWTTVRTKHPLAPLPAPGTSE